jgi:hypothetical protein
MSPSEGSGRTLGSVLVPGSSEPEPDAPGEADVGTPVAGLGALPAGVPQPNTMTAIADRARRSRTAVPVVNLMLSLLG